MDTHQWHPVYNQLNGKQESLLSTAAGTMNLPIFCGVFAAGRIRIVVQASICCQLQHEAARIVTKKLAGLLVVLQAIIYL